MRLSVRSLLRSRIVPGATWLGGIVAVEVEGWVINAMGVLLRHMALGERERLLQTGGCLRDVRRRWVRWVPLGLGVAWQSTV